MRKHLIKKLLLITLALLVLWGCSARQQNTGENTSQSGASQPQQPVSGVQSQAAPKPTANAATSQPLPNSKVKPAAGTVNQSAKAADKIKLNPIPSKTPEQSVEISGSTQPDYKIFINGKSVPIDSQGAFKHSIDLYKGNNTLKVVAYDQTGVVETKEASITYAPPPPRLLAVAPEQSSGEYVTVSGTTDSECIVYVGDKKASPDKKGNFTSTALLKPGKNFIKIISTNKIGGTATVTKQVTFQPKAPKLVVVVPGTTQEQPLNITGFTDENTTILIFANDKQAQVTTKDGVFTASLPLQKGLNPIWIEAANKWGQRTRKDYMVSYYPQQ